jgi:flavin-binding protein dodecin
MTRRDSATQEEEKLMPTIKILELVGVSENSFHDAVDNALEEAGRTVRGISGLEVVNTTAKVRDGQIAEYHANVKFAFPVERG